MHLTLNRKFAFFVQLSDVIFALLASKLMMMKKRLVNFFSQSRTKWPSCTSQVIKLLLKVKLESSVCVDSITKGKKCPKFRQKVGGDNKVTRASGKCITFDCANLLLFKIC